MFDHRNTGLFAFSEQPQQWASSPLTDVMKPRSRGAVAAIKLLSDQHPSRAPRLHNPPAQARHTPFSPVGGSCDVVRGRSGNPKHQILQNGGTGSLEENAGPFNRTSFQKHCITTLTLTLRTRLLGKQQGQIGQKRVTMWSFSKISHFPFYI